MAGLRTADGRSGAGAGSGRRPADDNTSDRAWARTMRLPGVVETSPLPGEELGLDEPVQFFFDQPMDRDTVQAAFRVWPVVGGALSWAGDSALTYRRAISSTSGPPSLRSPSRTARLRRRAYRWTSRLR